ncbi:hypothetical protein DVZ84_32795, partial [Streptomyces parvulus]
LQRSDRTSLHIQPPRTPTRRTYAVRALGVWAWGHHTGGHQAEANGKKGAVVAAGAALGLGAANGIVAFFSGLGSQVH